jgi:predicted nucleotidyltransferase component of viral defense system
MLQPYQCKSAESYQYALTEIMQSIALLGLWRAKFFEQAAFYGGTALRILHGLDRFSEDLDFSLLKKDPHFKLEPYNEAVRLELDSFGFQTTVTSKEKSFSTDIQSAFIKTDTKTQLWQIDAPGNLIGRLYRNHVIKIKMEIDINPPPDFKTETHLVLQPIPFSVTAYQLPYLYAGKMHAILCRKWKNRVKGRDFYDWVWYVTHKIPLNLKHLEARLRQSGHWTENCPLTQNGVEVLLADHLDSVDFEAAKKDVIPFLKNSTALQLWGGDFFKNLIQKMVFQGGLNDMGTTRDDSWPPR